MSTEVKKRPIEQRRERIATALLAGVLRGNISLSSDPTIFHAQATRLAKQAVTLASCVIETLDKYEESGKL